MSSNVTFEAFINLVRSRLWRIHPAVMVLGSFLLVILLGALILKLPVSTVSGQISWINALFTATSAVCVTGLVVVDTGGYFSVFGQLVILVLIQIGGLGVMTISVAMFRWIGRAVSFRQRLVIQDLFAHTPRADIFSLVKNVFFITICAEAIGALLLTIRWANDYPFAEALFKGVFHSVSAFCNAGFALYADSVMSYADSLLVNLTICGLIVIGGLGFPVLYDIQFWLTNRKDRRIRLSVQTKIVLITTVTLIVFGAGMFSFLEYPTLLRQAPMTRKILAPIFQSVTCRTAGFNTVNIGTLGDATLAMMIFLMFFGASPGSCGGGVKTTTLALLSVFMVSRVRRYRRVNLFKKSVPLDTVTRSISLVLLAMVLIGLVSFMLLIGDSVSGHRIANGRGAFLLYLFETVSAFGTVGLSMGITQSLNLWGKCWIIGTMVVGRVGLLTFAYIIAGSTATKGIEYSEENLMIG